MAQFDGRTKGLPAGASEIAPHTVAGRGWNVLAEDLPLPLAVLHDSALQHNARWMRRFVEHAGVALAPHVKTSMSPELIRRQLADGVWGLTVANAQQLRVVLELGARRVIVANQLVGRQAIDYVVHALQSDPSLEIFVCVDAVANARALAEAAAVLAPTARLSVLLETGYAGGRAGCRTLAQALEVARAVHAGAPGLALRGVEGFEGLLGGPTPTAREERIRGFLDLMLEVAQACARERLFAPGPLLLTAGGSAFFDLVAKSFGAQREGLQAQCVLRSGCYLTHDNGLYERELARLRERNPGLATLNGGLRAALEVWAYVQSRPEPGLAILTMGRRDVSYDIELPLPLRAFRPGSGGVESVVSAPAHWRISALNDQHAYLALAPEDELKVGDMVACGVSHPCTTFDKWRLLMTVDDAYNVTGAVTTLF
jgi:D-serine dehydratase